ncbi:MAG: alpha-amylase family glycosyl hydrolase [Candidatus Nanohalobium sp.]
MQEWLQNSVIYQVFIDRFAGFEDRENWHNPEFVGGDLQGLKSRLDYIEELGIDVIWISPFYKTNAYHGYHITDYYSVDPRFGTEKELRDLIEEVHSRDMKIIADFVPNHCSTQHPFFKEASTFPNSKYRDWFYFKDWPDNYLGFLDFEEELAKINLENQEARQHITDAAKKWLKLGLDGYRLDHVVGPSNSFWKHFEKEIHSDFPDAALIGEAWWSGISFQHLETFEIPHKYIQGLTGSQELVQKNYQGLLNGVLDFKAREIVLSVLGSRFIPDSLAKHFLKLHYSHYPENFQLPNFLDNHDTDRALYKLGNNKEKLKKAFKLLLKQEQPTIIYYGTEIGMTQHQPITSFDKHGDLQAREPMKWEDKDKQLLKWFKKQIKTKASKTS